MDQSDATDPHTRTDSYRIAHDWDGDDSLTETIVAAIATIKDTRLIDLDPLYNSADPDALERLFRDQHASRHTIRVSFQHEGYAVVINGDGSIDIDPSPPAETTESGEATEVAE